jgi:catechol 2,3-dioxygenase-like lactoylglutathione lyase family enzyme
VHELKGFNHFSATVADMDRALRFWRDKLGLKLAGRGVAERNHLDQITGLENVRIEWAELEIPGGGLIELFRYESPAGQPLRGNVNDPGKTHVCFEVNGIEALLSELQADGIRSVNDGAIKIESGDWKGWKSVYVRAPDDVVVELVEPPQREELAPE